MGQYITLEMEHRIQFAGKGVVEEVCEGRTEAMCVCKGRFK